MLDSRDNRRVDEVLADFCWDPMPAFDNRQSWRWSRSKSGILLDFLTQTFGEDSLRFLVGLVGRAQAKLPDRKATVWARALPV